LNIWSLSSCGRSFGDARNEDRRNHIRPGADTS
jgi:hypothetical protein